MVCLPARKPATGSAAIVAASAWRDRGIMGVKPFDSSQALRQAEAAFAGGQASRAIGLLRRVSVVNPSNAMTAAMLALSAAAVSLDRSGRLRRRIPVVRPADLPRLYSALGQYFAAAGDAGRAVAAQKQTLVLAPGAAVRWIYLSLLRSRLEPKRDIESGFDRATLLDPGNARFRHIVAEVAGALDNPHWARRHARAALVCDPSVASGWGSLAVAAGSLSKRAEALRAARAAVTIAPAHEAAWLLFVQVATEQHADDCARVVAAHLRAELASAPAAVAVLKVLREAGFLVDAQARLNGLLRRLGAKVPELWRAQAELAAARQDEVAADRSARRAAILDPGSAASTALSHAFQPDRDQAIRARRLLRLFVANAPGVGDAHQAFARTDLPRHHAGIRDLLRLAASAGSRETVRKCVFIAALLAESAQLPFDSPQQRERVDAQLGGELDLYVDEVRGFHVDGQRGVYARPMPVLAERRTPPAATADSNACELTVLVPTGNRLFDVASVLPSYLPAIAQGVEFVFSVYADREGTAAYLRRHLADQPNVAIVETGQARFSKAAAVNAAAGRASGRFLLLLDSDCRFVAPESWRGVLDRLRQAPDDVHSFGYRGMIGLRHALFLGMGMFPQFLIDAQLAIGEQSSGARETDDFPLICEFLLRYQTRHWFWGRRRFELIDLAGARWSAEMRPNANAYEHLIDHFGEYRVLRRGGSYLDDLDSYRDQYHLRGHSLRLDPFMTKMRRYIEREALARVAITAGRG